MTKKQIENQIKVLKETIQWFKKQIEPHDCGWMHTTIDGLKHRIKVLKDKLKNNIQKQRTGIEMLEQLQNMLNNFQ